MTITPISTLAMTAVAGLEGLSGSLAADLATLQGSGSFAGLFTALLAAASDTELPQELPADFLANLLSQPQLETEIAGQAEALSPEALAHLLQSLLKKKKQDDADTPEDGIIALGALSTPVESNDILLPDGLEPSDKAKSPFLSAPTTPALSKTEQEETLASSPKPNALPTEKVLPSAANLAGKSEDGFSSKQEEKQDFNQFLREATQLTAAKTGTPDAPRATLSTPVASPAWGERLGEQILWMSKNGQQQVDLKLHPANLGPLSISLNLEGDKATLHFTVATQEVRQAIEEAMPRLREMMAAAGVSLGQTDVDEQTRRETAARDMAGQHGGKDQPPTHPNDGFAENSSESPEIAEQHDRNIGRASILADILDGHALPFTHRNGRIGGIDLFA